MKFFPKIDKSLSNNITKCRRTVFSAVTQLITGHNFLARHEALVNTDNEEDYEAFAECQYCNNGEETSFHILAECDAFALARMSIWGTDTLEAPFNFLKNIDIIAFLRTTKIEAFINILDYELQ